MHKLANVAGSLVLVAAVILIAVCGTNRGPVPFISAVHLRSRSHEPLPIILTPVGYGKTPRFNLQTPFPRVLVECPKVWWKNFCFHWALKELQKSTDPLLRITPSRLVILSDDDVAFSSWTPRQLTKVFESFGKRIVFSSERVLYPPQAKRDYRKVDRGNQNATFLQAGTWMGRASDVEETLAMFGNYSKGKVTDQHGCSKMYLDNMEKIGLDTDKRMFFSLSDVMIWHRDKPKQGPPPAAYKAVEGGPFDGKGHLTKRVTYLQYDAPYVIERLWPNRKVPRGMTIDRTHWLKVEGCDMWLETYVANDKLPPTPDEEEEARKDPLSDLHYRFTPSYHSFAFHAAGVNPRVVFKTSFDLLEESCHGEYGTHIHVMSYPCMESLCEWHWGIAA